MKIYGCILLACEASILDFVQGLGFGRGGPGADAPTKDLKNSDKAQISTIYVPTYYKPSHPQRQTHPSQICSSSATG
jgi:hypothetical protein